MRNRLLGALTLTALIAAGSAFAADSTMPGSAAPAAGTSSSSTTSTTTTTTEKSDAMKMSHSGVVKSFDAKTHMLTLKDGSSFMLDETLKGDDLKANDKVSFSYKTDGTHKVVTEYKIENKS